MNGSMIHSIMSPNVMLILVIEALLTFVFGFFSVTALTKKSKFS